MGKESVTASVHRSWQQEKVQTLDREAGLGVAGRSVSVTLSIAKCSLSAVFFVRRGC